VKNRKVDLAVASDRYNDMMDTPEELEEANTTYGLAVTQTAEGRVGYEVVDTFDLPEVFSLPGGGTWNALPRRRRRAVASGGHGGGRQHRGRCRGFGGGVRRDARGEREPGRTSGTRWASISRRPIAGASASNSRVGPP
jgi:hypothetical protein